MSQDIINMNKLGVLTRLLIAIAIAALVFLGIPQSAQAGILITIAEVESDVKVTLSGNLNLSGLTTDGTYAENASGLKANVGLVAFNTVGTFYGDSYIGLIDKPANLIYGTGEVHLSDRVMGDSFLMNSSGTGGQGEMMLVEEGYSGGTLSSTMTFNNTDLATLGIKVGTYSSGFNHGADTITIKVVSRNVPK